jgi:hypothetical protein
MSIAHLQILALFIRTPDFSKSKKTLMKHGTGG